MENATKALLIVAEVLIGVLILSLAIYLYGTFSNYTKNSQEQISATELAKFNDKFLAFANRNDVTIQEIISLKNYVLTYNDSYYSGDYYNFEEAYRINKNSIDAIDGTNSYVDVTLNDNVFRHKSGSILGENSADLLKQYITSDSDHFTCVNIQMSTTTGRVYNIIFSYP